MDTPEALRLGQRRNQVAPLRRREGNPRLITGSGEPEPGDSPKAFEEWKRGERDTYRGTCGVFKNV